MELAGRYSNPDEWDHLVEITRPAAAPEGAGNPGDNLAVSSREQRPWRVTYRLGNKDVQDLVVRDRKDGVTQIVLANRYGISLSSVKRILRRDRGS